MIPEWVMLDAGADAAEDLLEQVFGVARKRVPTDVDPLAPDGFEALVRKLFGAMVGVVGPRDRRALQSVQTLLDVNWPHLSPAEREAALNAIGKGLGGIPNVVVEQVDRVLAVQGPQIIAATKESAAATFDLPIRPSFNLVDQRIIDAARTSQAHYIRNQYGARVEAASAKARDIVAKGLERGLDRYAIAEELKPAMEAIGVQRSVGYFGMIASVFAARARTWGTIAAFDEAGITSMEWVSQLDEATSDTCRFLDGKVFPVAAAKQRFEQVAAAPDPEAVVELQPWVVAGKAKDGSVALYYKQGGERRPIAMVERSGVGAKDDRGEYSRAAATDKLIAAGITSPPAHAHCRSLLAPASAVPSAQVPAQIVSAASVPTSAQVLPYAGTGVASPASLPHAGLPPNLSDLVRPAPAPPPAGFNPEALPKYTTAELQARAAEQQKQAAIQAALAKLAALPRPTPGLVASPLPTTDALGPSFLPPAPTKPQIAGGKNKKPVQVLVDEVHGLPVFTQAHAVGAVQSFDPSEPVLLVKNNGVLTPLNASENYKLLAAKMHGQATIQGKVIDLDKLGAKKPKASPAPPSPPPSVIGAAKPLGDAANILHQKTGAAKGSNDGGFYTGKDGVDRYVKFYDDPAQAHCEHLANILYADLGHAAPSSTLFEHQGKTAYASDLFKGGRTLKDLGGASSISQDDARALMKAFVGDVLTGNWDAVGTGFDNVMKLPDGRWARIDNGGTFLMRAKEGRKPEAALNAITEWTVFFSAKNPYYQQVAARAGYSSPEDFKDEVAAEIRRSLAVQKAAGGWSDYVSARIPGCPAADRQRIIEMLTERSKLLEEQLAELTKPAPPPPAPGAARFLAKQYSTVMPKQGLRLEDLPETTVIEDHYEKIDRHNPTKMPSGESYAAYRKRAEEAVRSIKGDGLAAIRSFTGSGYRSIRESEERGAPDSRSDAIQRALDQAPAEPGTVWRGICNLREDVITKHLENGVLQLGQKGGATSSTAWCIDVSIDSFMDGAGDGSPGAAKILYKLHGKTQVPVETISSVGASERELMMKRDAVFRVTGLSRAKGRRHVLVVEAEEVVGAEKAALISATSAAAKTSPSAATPPVTKPQSSAEVAKAKAKIAALPPAPPGKEGPEVLHGLEHFGAGAPPTDPKTIDKSKVSAAQATPPVLVSPSSITLASAALPQQHIEAMLEDAIAGVDDPFVLVKSGGKLYSKNPKVYDSVFAAYAAAGKPVPAHIVNLDPPVMPHKDFPEITAGDDDKATAKLASMVETSPGKVPNPSASPHVSATNPAPTALTAVPQAKIDMAKKKPAMMLDPSAITLTSGEVDKSNLEIFLENAPTKMPPLTVIKTGGKFYVTKGSHDAIVGGLALLGKPVPAHVVDLD